MKVDVDKCQETAAAQGVSAMPTFIFYRNKVNYDEIVIGKKLKILNVSQSKIDRLQGANVQALEAKIQQHIGTDDDDSEDYGQGLVNISFKLKAVFF